MEKRISIEIQCNVSTVKILEPHKTVCINNLSILETPETLFHGAELSRIVGSKIYLR